MIRAYIRTIQEVREGLKIILGIYDDELPVSTKNEEGNEVPRWEATEILVVQPNLQNEYIEERIKEILNKFVVKQIDIGNKRTYFQGKIY